MAEPDRPYLREEALRRALSALPGPVWDVHVVAETGSTNEDVAALAQAGAPEGTALVAEYQRSGRGRLDRSWTSPPRASLTFSVLLRPAGVPTERWGWLPLLAGCAVHDAVAELTGLALWLKWPNDVILVDEGAEPGERKVCGILAQSVDTPTGAAAVLGVGLNVSLQADELPTPDATSLVAAGASVDREALLRSLLHALGQRYEGWRGAGAGLRDAYRSRCATIGRQIRMEVSPGRWVEGLARDVDDRGALVVASAAGDAAWHAGDVLHVR